MLNHSHLTSLQKIVKNEINLDDHSEVDMNVNYIIENIKENLGVIENKFTNQWDEVFNTLQTDCENKNNIICKRISILMVIDNLIEDIAEKIEKEIKKAN